MHKTALTVGEEACIAITNLDYYATKLEQQKSLIGHSHVLCLQ
jgi:hypothetical protein